MAHSTQDATQAGKADAKRLMDKWEKGEGNTSSSNFTTPGDKANPRNFEDDLAKEGEPSYQRPEQGSKTK